MVDNNTPDRLYYYCQNHKKMGGVINVINSQRWNNILSANWTEMQQWKSLTVNSSGGVIAVKNLQGGTGI